LAEKKKLPLIWKIAIGFVAGILAGLIFGEKISFIAPIGTIFVALLRMLVVPLVFASLVVGTASIGDPLSLGRVGVKTVALYLFTTAIAIAIGLTLGNVVSPGVGMGLGADLSGFQAPTPPKMGEVIIGLFPSNPVASMAQANMLQIIVFALFLGISAVFAGEKGKILINVMDSVAETMYKMTGLVMKLAPYGVFALIATTVAKYGISVMAPFGKVIFAVYLGCIIHAVLVYSGLLTVWARVSPIRFFDGVKEATLTAFVTRSSSATLPITMRVTQENIGVSEKISSFVLPLGATINMDGTALYQGVCALFVAQAFGIELSIGAQIGILLTATLASIGTAGVPGAGLIMLTLVLTQAGLPVEGVALIAGIDAVLDMARTAINVTGDAMVATVIAKTEGELTDVKKAA
jgi:Na+/H+-dicarboxylate symporter